VGERSIEDRLRALEPCTANYEHVWDDGACLYCKVPAPPRYQGPPPKQPAVPGCARHPMADLTCSDCEAVVRERVERRDESRSA
jgi:hypothetical protein